MQILFVCITCFHAFRNMLLRLQWAKFAEQTLKQNYKRNNKIRKVYKDEPPPENILGRYIMLTDILINTHFLSVLVDRRDFIFLV